MKITALSEKEIELLARLEYEGREIYTRNEITSFCKNKKMANYLIKKMLEKRRLKKVIKNIYILIPMKAPHGKWVVNEYLVAKALARKADYYIGYASVFNSYGFTDQVSQMIYIVNNTYSFAKTIFGVRYKLKKVLSNRLYGLEKRKIGKEEVVFPKKERAIIDVFEFYDVKRAFQILQSQLNLIDKNIFIEYLSRYPVQIIRRRIGYLLEQLGVNKKLLKGIKVGKKGYSPLYKDHPKRGELNDRWRIIVNG
ncbi:MAG: hypothetical protein HQ596_01400 [Candidatus Saganbacteria bacterium]|nr:hypothetical protein [Candidatus Saganbacteria bacterium]